MVESRRRRRTRSLRFLAPARPTSATRRCAKPPPACARRRMRSWPRTRADLAAFDAAGGTPAFRDRLALTPARVEAMAAGMEAVSPPCPTRWRGPWPSGPGRTGCACARIATPDRRDRHDLRKPAQCRRRRRRPQPEIGQRASSCAAAPTAATPPPRSMRPCAPGCAPPACRRRRCRWRRRSDRAYVAAMLAGAGLIDLLIPRGGKPRWCAGCRRRRACRCSPMPRGFAIPTSMRPPTRRWRGGAARTRRCAAPGCAAPPRRC